MRPGNTVIGLAGLLLLTACFPTRDDFCAQRWELLDQDGDGYANAQWEDRFAEEGCDLSRMLGTGDCDDEDALVHPQAVEICDGLDNDCDGTTDPEDALEAPTWYQDADGDDYGVTDLTVESCGQPTGFADNPDDCDDTDPTINPDTVWYGDTDGDGFGSEEYVRHACEQPDDFVAVAGDCDDTDPTLNPDTLWYPDTDQDGFGIDEGATASCEAVSGASRESGDCDDLNNTIYPGADEYCDEVDHDCDERVDDPDAVDAATWWGDTDEDGYGDVDDAVTACSQPAGTASNPADCDDLNNTINPAAIEVCDGVDQDCNGTEDGAVDAPTWYADDDGDGQGDPDSPIEACDEPSGHAANGDDCDDASATTYLGAEELCDDLDNDCDLGIDEGVPTTTWYGDGDGDGYGVGDSTLEDCQVPSGYASTDDDCDDGDPSVHPGAAEVCEDGLDNDCDGTPGTCLLSGEYSLADADYVLSGDAQGDYAGRPAAAAGDLNADGFGDLVVGAYLESSSGDSSGAAYLIAGPLTGSGYLSDLSVSMVQGDAEYDYAGVSVAGAGDIDGDGLDDVLVGAYGEDSGASSAGAAYLLLGPATVSGSLGDVAVATFTGDGSFDYAGRTVAAAGDVDGDGVADLLIAAESEDTGGSSAGAVYLVLGPASSGGSLGTLASAMLTGEEAYAAAGESIAGAVDLDGDGADDLVIGAAGDDGYKGAAYVVYGPASSGSLGDVADAKLTGSDSYEYAGDAVAGVGDVDGDGNDDLLVGAWGDDTAGSYAGAAYLVLGPVTGGVLADVAEAILTGESPSDDAGESVAGAGDVDGDGFADFLVGADYEDTGGSNAGAAYLVLGPVSGTASLSSVDAKLTGEGDDDRAGNTLASAGDLDGDGYPELMIGAYGVENNRGATYVFEMARW